MKYHGIAYCIHCTTVPAVKFGLCHEHLQQLQDAVTAAQVAQLAAQRDPNGTPCKSCEDSACTLSDGLCPVCRRAVA